MAKEKSKNDFKSKDKKGQAAIKRLAKPIKKETLVAQVLAFISSVLSVAPYVALVNIGSLLIDGSQKGILNEDAIWDSLVKLILFYSLGLLTYFLGLVVTHFADMKLRRILRKTLTKKMSKAPLSWFSDKTSGNIRKLVQDDTKTVHTVIAHAPIEILTAVVKPLALWIYAMSLDFRLGLISIATIPMYFLIYSYCMRGVGEKTAEMNVYLADVSSKMVEFVDGINVVKAFGKTGEAHGAYTKAANKFTFFYSNWCMPLVPATCLSFAWVSIPVLLLVNLGLGALLVNGGHVEVSEMLASTLISLVLPGAIVQIATITWSYQMAGSAAQRVSDAIDTEQISYTDNSLIPNGNDVEIKNLSYSYEDTKAIDKVNLTLDAGTVTAVMGPSGGGKSTLAKMIARFDDPDEGYIKIGGVNLKDMNESTLYDHVAFVLQDSQLIKTSIFNNIALSKNGASLDDVRKVAKDAQIDEYIMTLPKQYDTILGVDTHLSGGQAQRISIARAILKNAPVLILDEATAMTDPENEALVQKALSKLIVDKTVLVIAHRPSSILGADQIAVMENGKIVAKGKHKDLLKNKHYLALLSQTGLLEKEEVQNEK